VATSSIGLLLKARGFSVTALKIDPYINVDAGTMNPTEHGEVAVLADGDECDQDMGNYERFLDVTLTRDNYMTTGRVYQEVIRRERNLEYKGACVQVVPHIPFEVIARIDTALEKSGAEIAVIEVGGTVGEYENILFLEAIRILKLKKPRDVAVVMVSYLPVPSKVGEMKTKPTQHAVRTLNSIGVHPDFILARSDHPLDKKRKEKMALFCNVCEDHIVSAPDVASIYDIPLNFEKEHFSKNILAVLGCTPKHAPALTRWKTFVSKAHNAHEEVKIAVVGKYFSSGDFVLSDVYISVLEAIKCAGYSLGVRPQIDWLDSTVYENDPSATSVLASYDGVLIPGGFGTRGIEGKIHAITFAREQGIPYFGLCYGMQLLVVEYARHVAGLAGAHTTEVAPKTKHPVVDILPEQKKILAEGKYGGTMRLGAYPAHLTKGTLAHALYKKECVEERHRHRFEVNPEYIAPLEKAGLVFSGKSPDGVLMEIAELPKEVQFHPEFTARPLSPHPLFVGFIEEALKRKMKRG
jgi:CTP synthase